ncbi:MAG: hypothetical protein WD971_11215, partial [Pirellulales bacterium]
ILLQRLGQVLQFSGKLFARSTSFQGFESQSVALRHQASIGFVVAFLPTFSAVEQNMPAAVVAAYWQRGRFFTGRNHKFSFLTCDCKDTFTTSGAKSLLTKLCFF